MPAMVSAPRLHRCTGRSAFGYSYNIIDEPSRAWPAPTAGQFSATHLPRDGQEKISTKPPRPPSIQVSSGALPNIMVEVGSA